MFSQQERIPRLEMIQQAAVIIFLCYLYFHMLLWLHNQNIRSATKLSERVEVLPDFTSQAISPHPSPVRN
jgi:hypothetical protein